jgi:hypothetical protein
MVDRCISIVESLYVEVHSIACHEHDGCSRCLESEILSSYLFDSGIKRRGIISEFPHGDVIDDEMREVMIVPAS